MPYHSSNPWCVGNRVFGAAEMPFAPHAGGVALRRQQLRDGDLPQRQPVRTAADRDFVGSRADREAAGHERRPRGRALRLDVEVEQAHAFAGELVDARRGRAAKDAAAVDAQLAIAEVVRQHEDDVRLPVRRLGRSRPGAEHQCRGHRAESEAADQQAVRRHCQVPRSEIVVESALQCVSPSFRPVVQSALGLSWSSRRSGGLDLRLHGFEVEARAPLHRRELDGGLASFSTSCCTKTKRQNSYLNHWKYSCEPALVPFSGQPVRSNGSSRRLVRYGQSTLTVPPSQPPGWSMKRYL